MEKPPTNSNIVTAQAKETPAGKPLLLRNSPNPGTELSYNLAQACRIKIIPITIRRRPIEVEG